jgi:photosystem II stability/assembly factor-like uncharacterized protein
MLLLLGDESRKVRRLAETGPEALIEEARRRRRRRLARRAAAVIGVAVAAFAAFGVASGGGSHRGVSGRAAKPAVAPQRAQVVAAALANVYTVHVASAEHVIVAGSGGVLVTSDAGVHWRTITPRSVSGVLVSHIDDIASFGGGRIWLEPVGDERMDFIPFTRDGGATWSLGVLPQGGLSGSPLSFWSPMDGRALGERNGGHVGVYQTDDGGASWAPVAGATPGPFGGPVTFTSAADAWTWNGGGLMYRTRDGGRTWQPVRLPAIRGYKLDGAEQPQSFGGEMVVAARLRNGSGTVRTGFYDTDDGGATWKAHLAPAGGAAFVAAKASWFTLSGPRLYATTNAGRTWRETRTHTPTGDAIDTIDYLSPTIGWAEAYGPAIGNLHPRYLLRSTDGGRTWAGAGLRQ